MKPKFPWVISSLLSFTAFSVILGSYSAQAETKSLTAAIPNESAVLDTQVQNATTWWNPEVDSTQTAGSELTKPASIRSAVPPLSATAQIPAAPEAMSMASPQASADAPHSLTLTPRPGAYAPVGAIDSLPQWMANSQLSDPARPSLQPISQSNSADLAIAQTPATPIELSDRPIFSLSAADLTPESANTEGESSADKTAPPATAQITRPIRRNPPGANFIGIGGNIGDNEDLIDFTILSKFKLIDLPFGDGQWTLSGRPSIALSNGIFDLRVPATIEFKQPTLTPELGIERLTPFAGGGIALSLERDGGDSELDLMLTGGADYLVSQDVSLTAMVNLLFLDDIDLEVQFGIGYNF